MVPMAQSSNSQSSNSQPSDSQDDPADAAALAEHAGRLADGIEAALPAWVERVVSMRWRQWRDEDPPPALLAAAAEAGRSARDDVVPRLRELLAADVDAQWTNPLSLARAAVVHPTRVLGDAGVPPVQRDEHAERLFPDDRYDLSPAAFADLDPGLHEPGLLWGAAKAHVVLARRRREGRRP
jgi:hypothetical protein